MKAERENDAEKLLHDLRIHQAELEMQNEELRSSRDALERARDEYALLYNRAPVGYVTLNAAGLICRANETFAAMAGRRDLVGLSFADLIESPDREVFLGRYGALFRRPESKVLEYRLKGAGGGIVGRISMARGDKAEELLVAVADITEQERARASLREAETLWTETFNAMDDAVWILDTEGRVLRRNPASEKLMGSPESIRDGCYCYQIFHGAPERPAECPYQRMLKSLAHEEQEFKLGEKWYEVGVDPLRNSVGAVIGSVHVVKDVTEKKLLLMEVHHRIKNNMNIVASILSLQAGGLAGSEAVQHLEEAQQRVLSMMLIYDRLYRSKDFLQVSTEEYFTSLIRSVLDQFDAGRRIRLRTGIDDFQIDSKLLVPLGIILNELLSNSFKYAFRGRDEGELRVELRRSAEGVVLTVANDGPGLEAGGEHGSGFGLLLIRGLTEQLRGKFRAETRNGAVFTLAFPLLDLHLGADE